jgi:hypothetical protein
MGNTTSTRRWALYVASVVAAVAFASCNDLPSAPTDDDTTEAGAEGPAPVACISTVPDPPDVAPRESITLDASCSTDVGPGASFEWDLGDGRSTTGQTVEALYSSAGEYTVRLSIQDGGASSEATAQIRVRPRPDACFVHQQIIENDPEPCTVRFDATCSTGSIVEYRWFFEGGPRPDLPLPDTNITTSEPQITYSWGRDGECFSFRPFDRLVRLTVVDEAGATDSHEETVVFTVPVLRQ